MIAFIRGVVNSVADGQAVIEQNGIGFSVMVPGSVLSRLTVGKEIKLLTYLQVKEDGMTLFGFLTQEERVIFLRLLSVSGVGPKAALSILTTLTPEQIILAVITNDALSLSRAPGVGKKLAARLTLELKDKLRSEAEAQDLGLSPQVSVAGTGPKQDAIDALTSLGYNRGEAVRAVMEIYVPDLDVEQTIKLALRKLAN